MLNLIKKITKCPAVSGRETTISEILRAEIQPYVDQISTDALGNLIAFKAGSAPKETRKKLMLAAHMDEIGFLVTFIEDNGFIRFAPIGGIHYPASAFTHVVFENGTRGVLVPQEQVVPADYAAGKFVCDIGTKSKKETERKVKIGDYFVIVPEVIKLSGTRLAGRPFDDRIGCVILLETARRMTAPLHDVYYVFTVQEEVGCRGSKPAAFSIAPDYALAYDVTQTGDKQDAAPLPVKLGGGAAIKIKDASVICDAFFVETLKSLAQENHIPYQMEILTAGGTDTSSMQMTGSGAHAGAISVPTRYIHSPVEMIDTADVESCIRLSCAVLAHPLA